jgi:phospholipid/cholesterol/gamma-HCH transport system substrate-binding protein
MHYIHRLSRKTVERIVGFVVGLTVAVIAVVVVSVGVRSALFHKHYRLHSILEQASGVRVGTAVKLSGVDVGSVERVRINEQNKVEIVLRIRMDFQDKIRKDAPITLASAGIGGDKFINIPLGSVRAAYYQDGETVTITTPRELSDLAPQLMKMMDQVEQLLGELQRVVSTVNRRTLADIHTILSDIKVLTANLRGLSSEVGELGLVREVDGILDSLTVTASSVSAASADLPGITRKVDELLVRLNRIAGALEHHWLLRGSIRRMEKDGDGGK